MQNTENKTKFKRRVFIIKKNLQYKYIIMVLLSMLIAVFTVGWDIYMIMSRVYSGMLQGDSAVSAIIMASSRMMVIKGIIVAALVVGVAVFVSLKLAGPIYRFEKSCQEVSSGNLSHRVRLRDGDELLELRDDFNNMLKNLSQKVRADRELILEIVLEIEHLITVLKNGILTQDEAELIKNRLEEIKGELDKVTKGFTI